MPRDETLHSIVAARQWLWVAMVALMAWGLWAAAHGTAGPPTVPPGEGGADIRMYRAVTARVAAGEDYYAVLAEEMPSRGYAIRPMFNWRLPTLTLINAAAQPPLWGRVLIGSLGFGVVVLWLAVVRIASPRAGPLGMPLLFMSVPVFLHPDAPYLHELWSGLAIAGSLGCRALGWRTAGVVLGGFALSVRELALPYVAAMAIFAVLESRKKEAGAWVAVMVCFGAYLAWHAAHVTSVMPIGGSANRWLVLGGWAFVLATASSNVFLLLAPPWLTAFVVPLAWGGLWRWSGPLGRRLAVTVTVYFGLFILAGRPDNWYWGLMIAPLLPLGFFGWFSMPTERST